MDSDDSSCIVWPTTYSSPSNINDYLAIVSFWLGHIVYTYVALIVEACSPHAQAMLRLSSLVVV
jgi:hypothetical protein